LNQRNATIQGFSEANIDVPLSPASYDRFSYTYNNPIKYADTSGHEPGDGGCTYGGYFCWSEGEGVIWLWWGSWAIEFDFSKIGTGSQTYLNIDHFIDAINDFNAAVEGLLGAAGGTMVAWLALIFTLAEMGVTSPANLIPILGQAKLLGEGGLVLLEAAGVLAGVGAMFWNIWNGIKALNSLMGKFQWLAGASAEGKIFDSHTSNSGNGGVLGGGAPPRAGGGGKGGWKVF
jgi:hypothetical protein